MKRSQMVKCLKGYIQLHLNTFGDCKLDDLAQELLTLCEHNGMIPPERVRYSDLENERTICSPECTWEKE